MATINAYFSKENSELDADTIHRAHAVKKLQKQCDALKCILPATEVKTLRYFELFCKEMSHLSDEYEQRILDLIPHQISGPELIPLLIDGLKIDETSLNIACLRKIVVYLEGTDDIQSVFQHQITPFLFHFCSSENQKLQFLALAVLHRICSLFEPEEDGWKMV